MRPVVILLLLSLCTLPVCAADSAAASASTSGSAPKRAKAKAKAGELRDNRAEIAQLKAGHAAAEVRKLLGAPERRVRKTDTPVGPVEAWIYHSRYTGGSRNVQTGSTSYARPNPLTGVSETITEPIMGVENTFVTEEHVLVFKDGRLIEWKSIVTDRSTTTS